MAVLGYGNLLMSGFMAGLMFANVSDRDWKWVAIFGAMAAFNLLAAFFNLMTAFK